MAGVTPKAFAGVRPQADVASMGNAFFVVQANAAPGQDAELNRWYEEQHLDDCLACDTAVAAQRFRKAPGSGPGDYAYLALYEVGNPQRFAENRRSKEGTPLLPRTPALALPAHAFFYRPAPAQTDLLGRQERVSIYIEFLNAGSAVDAAERMTDRQRFLAKTPGLGASELMLVDAYQEHQGWHAAGIIFAEVFDGTGDMGRPALSLPAAAHLTVAVSGLYRPISLRRTRT